MMGAAETKFEDQTDKLNYANKMGIVVDRDGIHFNEGMRGYAFGLAYLGWFLHPILFIAATTLVLAVLYRHEFHSNELRAMQAWDQSRQAILDYAPNIRVRQLTAEILTFSCFFTRHKVPLHPLALPLIVLS